VTTRFTTLRVINIHCSDLRECAFHHAIVFSRITCEGKRTARMWPFRRIARFLGMLLVPIGLYVFVGIRQSTQEIFKPMQDGVEFSMIRDLQKSAQDNIESLQKILVETVVERVTEKANDGPEQPPPEDVEQPLNIVLFYADDWTMKTLGMLNPVVKTPNIDQMARNGVMFTSNCVTTSICWISRATLSTGQYASRHQHLKISSMSMFSNHSIWSQTLFPQLKAAGYYTGHVGKWHAPSPPDFMKYTFDYHKMYYGSHWEMRGGVRRHVTDLNQEDALEFLRKRPKDKTFALNVAFFATHAGDGKPYPMQYQPMNSSMAWYVNDTIPNPKTNTQKHWDDLPWFFDGRNEGRKRWMDQYDTPEHYQVSMKNYYRMATEVDHVVGEVIKELKEQGVYNNTLIVFTTDNGVSIPSGGRVCGAHSNISHQRFLVCRLLTVP
jgi:hypothetical protein